MTIGGNMDFNEFIQKLNSVDGKTAKEIIKNFLIWFLILNTLITFFLTQVIKKTLQLLRLKYRLFWIKDWLFPLLALLCGLTVVAVSFLLYAVIPSLWLILTFGLFVGLAAIGLFAHYKKFLGNQRFYIDLWNVIWKKIGFPDLAISEQEQLESEWKKLKEKEKELDEREKQLNEREANLDRLSKSLSKKHSSVNFSS